MRLCVCVCLCTPACMYTCVRVECVLVCVSLCMRVECVLVCVSLCVRVVSLEKICVYSFFITQVTLYVSVMSSNLTYSLFLCVLSYPHPPSPSPSPATVADFNPLLFVFRDCPRGFIYGNSKQMLKICQLPAYVTFDHATHW